MKFYGDKLAGKRNVHSKYQVSRTSESLFLYCKILQNCNFLYLFELGCHKNQYNDMKLYMDKLRGRRNLHVKFQVSRSTESSAETTFESAETTFESAETTFESAETNSKSAET